MQERFCPRKSVVYERFGDETVIVNLETGCYYSVQNTADAIWTMAVNGRSRSEILKHVTAQCSSDTLECATATTAFLDELLNEKLLDMTDVVRPTDGITLAFPHGAFIQPQLQKYTDMEELLQLDPIHEIDELGWPSAKTPTA